MLDAVGGVSGANAVDIVSRAQTDAQIKSQAGVATDAAKAAKSAALDATRSCGKPAEAQAAADKAKQAAATAADAAAAVLKDIGPVIDTDAKLDAYETSQNAAVEAGRSARDAQAAADRAKQSGCEGVPVGQAIPPNGGANPVSASADPRSHAIWL